MINVVLAWFPYGDSTPVFASKDKDKAKIKIKELKNRNKSFRRLNEDLEDEVEERFTFPMDYNPMNSNHAALSYKANDFRQLRAQEMAIEHNTNVKDILDPIEYTYSIKEVESDE